MLQFMGKLLSAIRSSGITFTSLGITISSFLILFSSTFLGSFNTFLNFTDGGSKGLAMLGKFSSSGFHVISIIGKGADLIVLALSASLEGLDLGELSAEDVGLISSWLHDLTLELVENLSSSLDFCCLTESGSHQPKRRQHLGR